MGSVLWCIKYNRCEPSSTREGFNNPAYEPNETSQEEEGIQLEDAKYTEGEDKYPGRQEDTLLDDE